MSQQPDARSAAFIHEPQEDGRVVVRHGIKKEWAIICQPDEIEKAEKLIDTRWRQMMFLLGGAVWDE